MPIQGDSDRENVSSLWSKNVISAFQVMRGEVFPLVNFKSYTGRDFG